MHAGKEGRKKPGQDESKLVNELKNVRERETLTGLIMREHKLLTLGGKPKDKES